MRGREGEVSFYTSAPFILAYLDRRSFVPREMGTVVKSGWEEGGGSCRKKEKTKNSWLPLAFFLPPPQRARHPWGGPRRTTEKGEENFAHTPPVINHSEAPDHSWGGKRHFLRWAAAEGRRRRRRRWTEMGARAKFFSQTSKLCHVSLGCFACCAAEGGGGGRGGGQPGT